MPEFVMVLKAKIHNTIIIHGMNSGLTEIQLRPETFLLYYLCYVFPKNNIKIYISNKLRTNVLFY